MHCVLGKMSFSDEQLTDNLRHFVETLDRIRPSSAKGQYIKRLVVSGAMTPSVNIVT